MADVSGSFLSRDCVISARDGNKSGLVISSGGASWMYQKIARDTGQALYYYSWTTSDINGSPPIAAPVGPWGDIKVMNKWVM